MLFPEKTEERGRAVRLKPQGCSAQIKAYVLLTKGFMCIQTPLHLCVLVLLARCWVGKCVTVSIRFFWVS